jgi:hypothetical protein
MQAAPAAARKGSGLMGIAGAAVVVTVTEQHWDLISHTCTIGLQAVLPLRLLQLWASFMYKP